MPSVATGHKNAAELEILIFIQLPKFCLLVYIYWTQQIKESGSVSACRGV